MKKNITIIAILALFIIQNELYGRGTLSGVQITNGCDKGIINSADRPGDSILYYEVGPSVIHNISSVTLTVAAVGSGYDLSPMMNYGERFAIIGETVSYRYRITNFGNTSDNLKIIVSEVTNTGSGLFTGNIYSIYQTTNIIVGPSNPVLWNTPFVSPGARLDFIVNILLPPDTGNNDVNIPKVEVLNNSGTGTNDQWPNIYAIAPSTEDLLGIRDHQTRQLIIKASTALMEIKKNVNYISAITNDILLYTISYSNISSVAVSNCYILDNLSQGAEYVLNSAENGLNIHNGSCSVYYWDGTAWQNSTFDSFATVSDIKKIKWSFTHPIQPGEKGYVRFEIQIN